MEETDSFVEEAAAAGSAAAAEEDEDEDEGEDDDDNEDEDAAGVPSPGFFAEAAGAAREGAEGGMGRGSTLSSYGFFDSAALISATDSGPVSRLDSAVNVSPSPSCKKSKTSRMRASGRSDSNRNVQAR